jgi:hypothetical protein
MLDNKFLDKVCDQIISESRIDNDEVYTPFFSPSYYHPLLISPYSLYRFFYSHCRDVYSLKNGQEIEYVWDKYKKEVTTLMDKKELIH